jgi:hypothetical protein
MTYGFPDTDDRAGILVDGPNASLRWATSLGARGTAASGTTAVRFTPERTITVTGYRVFCEYAPTSTGTARLCVWASNGTTQLTKSAADGTTTPLAGTVTATTASANSALTGTLSANSGGGSVAALTLVGGITYWVGLFANAAFISGSYAGLCVPSFYGSTLATADGVFLSGTGTPSSLAGATVDSTIAAIALTV